MITCRSFSHHALSLAGTRSEFAWHGFSWHGSRRHQRENGQVTALDRTFIDWALSERRSVVGMCGSVTARS